MKRTEPDPNYPYPSIVLLHKKPGETSFQALFPVKRLYGTSVGHTGTLDQFAQGLLVVLTGAFTRLNPLFTNFDKVYEADFTFGKQTDTLDPDGVTVWEGPVPSYEAIETASSSFVGTIDQIPPAYSAVHIDGKRAYERVRKGEVVVLPARTVTIYTLELLNWSSPVLTVRVHCSKGTYIRSLARDWGKAVGSGAFVSRLVRKSVGPFASPDVPMEVWDSAKTLEFLGIARMTAHDAKGVRNALPPVSCVDGLDRSPHDQVGLFDLNDRFLALVRREGRKWRYAVVNSAL